MQSRREFLKESSAVALTSMLLPSFLMKGADVHNPGIQLYSVRKEMLQDAAGTLKLLAGLGYKQIESAGSVKGNYYGLKPLEIKNICKDLGLTIRSGHVHLDDQWQQTMNDAAEVGQEYLICSSMPAKGQTVDNYKKTAEVFNKTGEGCKKLNLKFGYHNHDYEFESENGKILYDVLIENTDQSLVHLEMDLGWVIAAGKDPIEYFKKFPGRFPLWHLKDMDLANKKSTEFGKGSVDIKKMLNNADQSGMKYFFVEQEEYSSTAIESLKYDVDYLLKIKL